MTRGGVARNYRVVGLEPADDGSAYHVVIEQHGGDRVNTLTSCAAWGTWPHYSREENAIVRRGLTQAGHDRQPRGRR